MSSQEISRRRMLGGAVGFGVVAASGVAGYLVAAHSRAAGRGAGEDGEYGASAGRPSGSLGTDAPGGAGQVLAEVDDIPDGGGIILSTEQIVLTRSGHAVRGFSSICTHQHCAVNAVQDGRIRCPCHGSEFDASTGAVVAGPAPRALPAVPVMVISEEVIRG